MSVLDKLKEKIEAWKLRIDELESENAELKAQLEHSGQDAMLEEKLSDCEKSVESMQKEIAEKDREFDEIVTKIEMLLEL